MPPPPAHLAARRAQQRARIRRRRRVALAAGAAVLAALVAGLVIVAGGGAAHGRAAHGRAAHGRAAHGRAAHGRRPRSLQPAVQAPGSARTGAANKGSSARDLSALATAEINRLVPIGLPIFCGGLRGNEVAFTFDDGPGVYTHYAVKKLAQAHEGATFFVVGHLISQWPGWLPRELKLGAIGDHTWTHPELIELSPSEIRSQLSMTAAAIHAASGENVDLWRSPYELHDATTDRIAQQLGLLQILWSVDSGDSVGANWAQIINNVEAGLKPGMIILFHENRGQTIRALTTLLPELRRRHLRSVSIPELLATDPPSVRQVREGLDACGTGGRQLLLSTGPGGGAGSGA